MCIHTYQHTALHLHIYTHISTYACAHIHTHMYVHAVTHSQTLINLTSAYAHSLTLMLKHVMSCAFPFARTFKHTHISTHVLAHSHTCPAPSRNLFGGILSLIRVEKGNTVLSALAGAGRERRDAHLSPQVPSRCFDEFWNPDIPTLN